MQIGINRVRTYKTALVVCQVLPAKNDKGRRCTITLAEGQFERIFYEKGETKDEANSMKQE